MEIGLNLCRLVVLGISSSLGLALQDVESVLKMQAGYPRDLVLARADAAVYVFTQGDTDED